MTTQTETTVSAAEPVIEPSAQASWNAGVAELNTPPDDQATNTEAAPSTEGVVTSGAQESSGNVAKQDAPEQKPVNLGGLSTNELLQRVKESPTDPDTLRALEIRLKRLDSQARPQRERSQKAQRAAAAADEVRTAVSGLKDDYPELANRLAPFSKLAEVVTQPIIEADAEEQNKADEAIIEDAFPGFNKLRSPDSPLAAWLKTQPASVQEQATRGGVAGGMAVLEQFERYEIANGRPSPFAPPAPATPPAPVAPAFDPAAEAARIKAERDKRLQSAAAVPNSSRVPARNTQETSAAAAWLAGVEQVRRERRIE